MRRVRFILWAGLLAACGAAVQTSSGPVVLPTRAPALPTAAVVAAAEGELTLEVAELI